MKDMIDLALVGLTRNSPDVHAWPVTAAITRVSFHNGVTRFTFTKQDGDDRWPDVTPPGWTGPLQYTAWLFVNNGNSWVAGAFVQFWHGRDGSGQPNDPDVPSYYHRNWYYSARWAPVFGHGPIQPGEPIGFMLTSGNARDNVGPMGPSERSNIVTLNATDEGEFTFPVDEPVPVPVPDPPPIDPPPAPDGVTLATLHADLREILDTLRAR
jgi:hypothetical protein